jgi:hypothetical protein
MAPGQSGRHSMGGVMNRPDPNLTNPPTATSADTTDVMVSGGPSNNMRHLGNHNFNGAASKQNTVG